LVDLFESLPNLSIIKFKTLALHFPILSRSFDTPFWMWTEHQQGCIRWRIWSYTYSVGAARDSQSMGFCFDYDRPQIKTQSPL